VHVLVYNKHLLFNMHGVNIKGGLLRLNKEGRINTLLSCPTECAIPQFIRRQWNTSGEISASLANIPNGIQSLALSSSNL